MNLLEHYIKEVHEVKDITNEFIEHFGYEPSEPLYQIDLTYNYCGCNKRKNKIFFKSEWEEIKKCGYFWG